MGEAKVFLRAEWRHLAMLNYEIEPAAIRPLVVEHPQWRVWRAAES